MSGRPVDKIVADLLDAVGAASELVGRGRDAYDSDRLLRLAGEAVIGRIGDSAAKLRDQHGDGLPKEIPWDDVIANRIIVDHVYHRVDYDLLRNTLERDVPALGARLRKWAVDRGNDLKTTSTLRAGPRTVAPWSRAVGDDRALVGATDDRFGGWRLIDVPANNTRLTS